MSKYTPTSEFTEAARTIIRELISSGVFSAMSSICQVTISDSESGEEGVTFSIARDPADVLSGLYSKMIGLDTENAKSMKADLKDIYKSFKTSIDDIELQDALLATFAHALVACRQNDDNATANALLSILDRTITDKKSGEAKPGALNEYKGEIIGLMIDISASGASFDPESLLASSTKPDVEEEDEEDVPALLVPLAQKQGWENLDEEDDDDDGDES